MERMKLEEFKAQLLERKLVRENQIPYMLWWVKHYIQLSRPEENLYSFEEYGIPGNVIWTPGHTSGSLSVLLHSGEAFVGDLAMNMFPLRLSPGLPIFAEDMSAVIKSWELLIDKGARMVYPAHGKPFPVSVIEKEIRRTGSSEFEHCSYRLVDLHGFDGADPMVYSIPLQYSSAGRSPDFYPL